MKKNILADVKPEHYFWLMDGTIIKNLNELYETMQRISDDVFRYHVNEQKNDFYNWVKDVHQDKKLAESLLKAKTREEMANCILSRIREIQSETKTKQKPVKKKINKNELKIKAAEKKEAKIIKKPEEIKFETIKTIKDTKLKIYKPYPVSGMIIAMAILIGLIASINLFTGQGITGAAVSDIKPTQYNWFVIIAVIIVIMAVVVFKIGERRLE